MQDKSAGAIESHRDASREPPGNEKSCTHPFPGVGQSTLKVPRAAVVVQSDKPFVILECGVGAADCDQTLPQIP